MSMLRLIVICVLLSLTSQTASAQVNTAAPELHRGLNLSSWLANAPRQPLFARDFDQIKRAGFDHIRLPFNPTYYGFHLSSDGPTTASLDFTALDRALAMADQVGLPVIIDLHPGGDFLDTLERP